MTWRPARSLDVLLAEVNKAAPKRNKASDGTVGDLSHSARASDHNPNSAGVVRARDITHGPKGGCDAGKLAEAVKALLGKHPALGPGAYVIYNRRIVSTSRLREGWRAYTGSNAHTKHVHVSVGTSGYDSTLPWGVFKPKPKPLNPVQKGNEYARLMLAEFDKAKGRPVVKARVALLRTVLKLMPKK